MSVMAMATNEERIGQLLDAIEESATVSR